MRKIDVRDFESIKDMLGVKLINTNRNRELLKNMPSYPFLEFSAVYYLLFMTNKDSVLTLPVDNTTRNYWEIDDASLYKFAMENTQKMMPLYLETMKNEIADMNKRNPDDSLDINDFAAFGESSNLYMLTNESHVYGSVAIMYPNLLHRFSEKMKCDLILVPLSINAVLITSALSDIDLKALKLILKYYNRHCSDKAGILSDHLYYYHRDEDGLEIMEENSNANDN